MDSIIVQMFLKKITNILVQEGIEYPQVPTENCETGHKQPLLSPQTIA